MSALPTLGTGPGPVPATAPFTPWRLLLGAWGLVAVIDATQAGFYLRVHEPELGWADAVERTFPLWGLWALLTPVVFALAERFPVDRGRLRRVLPVHLLAALAVAAAGALAGAGIAVWLGWPAQYDYGAATLFRKYFGGRLHLSLLIYAALVGVHHAVAYRRRLQEREAAAAELRTRLAEAQLQSLKTQLQPHFLFNTLNAISVLALKGETQCVVRMLSRLSELLRLTLDSSVRQEVPLRQELDVLERYVDIERVRFGDRLTVSIDAEPEACGVPVPALLLQPLVENSIRHGIAQTVGPGRVEVRAFRREASLRIEVRDTGGGFPAGTTLREGIGLSNVRARLAHLYGSDYRFVLGNAAGGGAEVVVELPFRVVAEDAPAGVPELAGVAP